MTRAHLRMATSRRTRQVPRAVRHVPACEYFKVPHNEYSEYPCEYSEYPCEYSEYQPQGRTGFLYPRLVPQVNIQVHTCRFVFGHSHLSVPS
jgi:hypothetical protein